jgi:1,4-alpha-glucan branching enzyme
MGHSPGGGGALYMGEKYSSIWAAVAGRVQIRVKAPEVIKVRVNFWSRPKMDMVKQPDGFWTVTTHPLFPGLHYYTFIIDGAGVADPNTHAYFAGSKPASAVEVPEPGSTYLCDSSRAAWAGA